MKNVVCFLHQRKQAKIQWLRDPNQSNVDNLKMYDIVAACQETGLRVNADKS